MPPAAVVMLKQEELAFLKAISTLDFSPALLRELRKAGAAKKRTKAVAPSKAKTFCVALIKRRPTISGTGSEAQSSRKPSQHIAGKRKAEELLSKHRRADGACHQASSARSATQVNEAGHFGRIDC